MMFPNRIRAGKDLAEKLSKFLSDKPDINKKSDMLVVGLPRGGVPVALQVCRKFGSSLEIIMSKKLPFPGQPEYAIGAVSSDGIIVLNPEIPQDPRWKAYIEQLRQELLERTMSSEEQFYALAGRTKTSFKDKTVIVVDDGVATGMTAIAALETARQRGAKFIIMAAPVISSDSVQQLSSHCDEVVAVSVPAKLYSVGENYIDFSQTSNEEVVAALREAGAAHHSQPNPLQPKLSLESP
jgi:predicted phosphoribosyltransferase